MQYAPGSSCKALRDDMAEFWGKQLILFAHPLAWTADSPQDEEDLKRIADSVASAIGAVNEQVYSTQRMGSVYVASGTFVDWYDHMIFTRQYDWLL